MEKADNEEAVYVLYDVDLHRPACALLQAAYGATPHIANEFNSEHWLIQMTPGMQPFKLTPATFKKLVEATNIIHAERPTKLVMRAKSASEDLG